MGVYTRALLEDIVHGKGDLIVILDMTAAIEKLISTGQLTKRHLTVLRLHLQGYTLDELLADYPDAYTLLVQAYALIADESGYTDEVLLQRGINLFPSYRKILPALREKAFSLGRAIA